MTLSKSAALVFGCTFVAVGIIGFIPNPLVHSEGIFVTNTMHNLVHIVTGLVFLCSVQFPGKEYLITLAIGGGYVMVSVLGFLTSGEYLLGIIHINQADRWLHLFLAVAILLVGRTAQNLDARNPLQSS